jgi:hypothetical protein
VCAWALHHQSQVPSPPGATCKFDDSISWDGDPSDTATARVVADTSADTPAANTTMAVTFSDVLGGGGWAGANGNIAADPQLLPGSGYSPAPGSPVINAGDPAYVTLGDTDRLGGTRVLQGRVDMGAVEFGNLNTPPVLTDFFKATVALGANQVRRGRATAARRGCLGLHPQTSCLLGRPPPPPAQILLVDWGDVYTDADGDAFTVLPAGGPLGLAENGVLSVGDATSATLKFTPTFGAKTAHFSTQAQDIKGGDSGADQISLTFGEPLLPPRARRAGDGSESASAPVRVRRA